MIIPTDAIVLHMSQKSRCSCVFAWATSEKKNRQSKHKISRQKRRVAKRVRQPVKRLALLPCNAIGRSSNGFTIHKDKLDQTTERDEGCGKGYNPDSGAY